MCDPCVTLLQQFGTIHAKRWQRMTKGNTLWPFAMSYTILRYSTVLPFTSTTFSNLFDTFGPFVTFLYFTLFNTLPNCVAFSGVFHQTFFTWLLHHSFGFSGIISGWLALHFTNVSCFILLLQLYLCFFLPPLPNRTESSPFDHPIVYWPQISWHLLLSLFPLKFLIYHTDHCHLFWNFIALSLQTFCLPEQHFLTILGPLSLYLHTHSPPFHCNRWVTLTSHFSLYCGVCSVVVQTI